LQLAASYLLIIMIMSISFSAVLYHTSAREIGRQLPPNSFYGQYPDADPDRFTNYFENRISTGQHELAVRLVILNIFVLILGAFLSYVLARRTLEPIEEAMDTQSRFASDASHELRTPLAAIQAENEVALRNPKLSLARAKALLASNLEEVTRLQDLSDGLLKLAHADVDEPLQLTAVSLSAAVSDAMNHCLKAAQAKNLAIDDQVPDLSLLANQQGLRQILNILLDNAIKYSPAGTTITLSGGMHNKQGFITVKDQGIGIAGNDLEHIFERFYRADQSRTSQQVSGHGLGLALADKIAGQLHGTITVKSTLGKGSEFTVSLPLAPASSE